MAITKREYIFVTFVISCVSLGFLLAAIGSQSWVVGEYRASAGSVKVNFGLFGGVSTKRVLQTPEYESLYVTCDYGENKCLLSCKTTAEARKAQITTLLMNCNITTSCNAQVDYCNSNGEIKNEHQWMNAGVYVTTLVFLALSIILALLSAFIGVVNTAKIPVDPLLGIFGLYIYHGCAAFSDLVVLLMWGIHFETNLKNQLAYTDIMQQLRKPEVSSSVGVSYWIILASMFLHLAAIGVLYLRQWLIDREPPPPMIIIDKNVDNTIFLY